MHVPRLLVCVAHDPLNVLQKLCLNMDQLTQQSRTQPPVVKAQTLGGPPKKQQDRVICVVVHLYVHVVVVLYNIQYMHVHVYTHTHEVPWDCFNNYHACRQ